MAMDTEESLQGVPEAAAQAPAGRPLGPLRPHVRLRRQRRAGREGDPHRRQDRAGRCASARDAPTTTSSSSTPPPPGTSSASSARPRRSSELVAGRAGPRPDRLDGRHPRRPAQTGVVIVADARGDAGQRDHRAGRPAAATETDVDLAAVVVNRVLPELFGRGEEEVFDALREPERRPRCSPRRVGGGVDPVLDARRLAVTLRRTRAAHLERAARRARPTLPLLYVPVPVRARPRPARHPHGRRGARRGARVLMAPRPTPRRSAASSSCSPPRRSSSPAAPVASARRPRPPPRRRWPRSHLGGKVLVLTVDPARRLANALGLEAFGNVETPGARRRRSTAAGVEPRGELWAAMLDTKQSWDDLVRRHAPDDATRDAILANPLYQNITGTFVQSHDYIAMERLYEIHASGTLRPDRRRHAAHPERHRLPRGARAHGRLLLQPAAALARPSPARSRGAQPGVASPSTGGRPHPRLAVPRGHRRVLPPLPDDVRRLRRAGRGGRAHAATTAARPSSSSPRSRPRRCARPEFFVDAARPRTSTSARWCSNKVLPEYVARPRAAASGRAPGSRGQTGPLADALSALAEPRVADPERTSRVLRTVAESFANFSVVAIARGRAARGARQACPDVVVRVPELRPRHHDVDALAEITHALYSDT